MTIPGSLASSIEHRASSILYPASNLEIRWPERLEFGVRRRRVVVEPRELVVPGELHVAGRAVALLADQELGLAADLLAVLLVRHVILLAVDEHHHVGILLDGA